LLSEDEQLAKDMLAETSEDILTNEIVTAPWDQAENALIPPPHHRQRCQSESV
jgi:hypothetical protein